MISAKQVSKKVRQVSPENWIVVENTHEPIVERELWDKVHSRMRTNSRVARTKEKTVGMFAGILRCADCNSPLAYMRKKLANGENRLAVIKTTIKNLYIDKCSGNLPEEVFKSMMEDFLKEQNELENQIPRLHDELEQISTATDEVNEWLNLITDFTNIETLTRAVVCELIESITVSDRQKVDGKWEQSIDIRYRFIGNLLQDAETSAKKENIA